MPSGFVTLGSGVPPITEELPVNLEQKHPYAALSGVLLLFVAIAISGSLIPTNDTDAAQLRSRERSAESEKYVGIRIVNLPTSGTGFVVGNELGNAKYRPFEGSGYSSYYAASVGPLAQNPLDGKGVYARKMTAHDLGYATSFTYPPDLSGTTLELLRDSFDVVTRSGETIPMLQEARKP